MARQELLKSFLSGDAPPPSHAQRHHMKKTGVQFRPEAHRTRKLLARVGVDLIKGTAGPQTAQQPNGDGADDDFLALQEELVASSSSQGGTNKAERNIHPKVTGLLHSLYDIDLEKTHQRHSHLPALRIDASGKSQQGGGDTDGSSGGSSPTVQAGGTGGGGGGSGGGGGANKTKRSGKLSPLAAQRAAERRYRAVGDGGSKPTSSPPATSPRKPATVTSTTTPATAAPAAPAAAADTSPPVPRRYVRRHHLRDGHRCCCRRFHWRLASVVCAVQRTGCLLLTCTYTFRLIYSAIINISGTIVYHRAGTKSCSRWAWR